MISVVARYLILVLLSFDAPLTLASVGDSGAWVQPREIEVINESGVGVAAYAVIDQAKHKLQHLQTLGAYHNVTIEVVPHQGDDIVEFHELCNGDDSEPKACRSVILEISEGTEKQGKHTA